MRLLNSSDNAEGRKMKSSTTDYYNVPFGHATSCRVTTLFKFEARSIVPHNRRLNDERKTFPWSQFTNYKVHLHKKMIAKKKQEEIKQLQLPRDVCPILSLSQSAYYSYTQQLAEVF